jgi:uncharacterized Ntn-hydrolase superfamily protein
VTYSITARDPITGRFGVAVQSCVFAVGTRVPNVHTRHGAISIQAGYRSWYRQPAAELLARDLSAPDVVAALQALPDGNSGQVAIVDRHGRAAAHTGLHCTEAAGHLLGDGVVTAGNLLARAEVWTDMMRAYEQHTGVFEDRLLAALQAGEAAGGDVRGRQSAAMVVTAADGHYEIDIRVDDAPDPVAEIGRVLTVKQAHDRLRQSFGSDVDGTVELLRTASDLAPDDPLITVWSAIGLARAGDWDGARAALGRAAKQNRWLVDYLDREPALRGQPHRDRLLSLARGQAH